MGIVGLREIEVANVWAGHTQERGLVEKKNEHWGRMNYMSKDPEAWNTGHLSHKEQPWMDNRTG